MGVDGERSENATGLFPVILGVREASACPAGYDRASVDNIDRNDGWSYIVMNDNSATIGGKHSWAYGGENYNQVHFNNTHVNILCWKFYETIGTPHASIQTINAGDCPSGYLSFDADQLKGWNDHGYIQQTAYGLYMGGLYDWARHAFLDGAIHHGFTNQATHKVCLRLENVIE